MEKANQSYSEEGPRRTIFVLLCVLFFTLGGGVLLTRLARLVKHSLLRRSVASCFGRPVGLRRLSAFFLAGAAGGHSAKQVAAKLQERRMIRAHASLPYGMGAAAITLALSLLRTTFPGPRRNSMVQDVLLMVVCFTTLSFWAFPRYLTNRNLNIWSSLIVVCICLAHSPVAMERDGDSSAYLLPFGGTMVVCLVNMKPQLNFAWMCAVCACVCSTILFGSEGECEVCLPPRMERVRNVVGSAFVFTIVVVSFHQSMFLVVRYEIEAHTSKNELQAARSVLRGVCDAVVELDSEFRLQDGAIGLVDMLLLNPQRPLQGEDLRSFLASEQDRQKFNEQMGRAWLSGEDAGLSAAFHVSMKDSSSIPLNVEVFCVRFVNREGTTAYFAGIREFTDTSPMLKVNALEPQLGGGLDGSLDGTTAFPSDETRPSSQESSSMNSEEFSWNGEIPREVELVAWFNALTADYTVLPTPAFAQYVDTRGGLLNAIRRSRREDFIGWVQDAYVALTTESPSPPDHVQHHSRLQFRSPVQQSGAMGLAHSVQKRQVISVQLRLDLTQPPDERDHGHGVVRIVLHDLRLDKGAPRGLQRQPLCGTPPSTARAAVGQLQGNQPRAALVGREQPEGRRDASAGSSSEPCPRVPAGPSPLRFEGSSGPAVALQDRTTPATHHDDPDQACPGPRSDAPSQEGVY